MSSQSQAFKRTRIKRILGKSYDTNFSASVNGQNITVTSQKLQMLKNYYLSIFKEKHMTRELIKKSLMQWTRSLKAS
jgi:hypothetical protein